jgi:hypothetical protein
MNFHSLPVPVILLSHHALLSHHERRIIPANCPGVIMT